MNKTIFILLLAVAVFQGCAHNGRSYEPTFTLREFYNMPIEDKVIAYIEFEKQGFHNPPERSVMQDMIALHGKEVIPIAAGIISVGKDNDVLAGEFALILKEVHKCCFNLRIKKYEDLLEELKNSRFEFNKAMAKIALETIRTQEGGRGDISRRRNRIEENLEHYERDIDPMYKRLKP